MMIKNNIHHQTDRENGSTGHLMCFFFLSNVETNNSLSYTKKNKAFFRSYLLFNFVLSFFFSLTFLITQLIFLLFLLIINKSKK